MLETFGCALTPQDLDEEVIEIIKQRTLYKELEVILSSYVDELAYYDVSCKR